MYLRDLADSLLRRWYFVVVALVLTSGACVLASRAIPPTFQTEASVVLIPPKSADDPTANRFLALSGLRQAVDVLARSLNSDKTHELVHAVAPEGKYEVTEEGATSAPVLTITAKASTPADANRVVDEVLRQVPVNLTKLQASLSIPRGAEITSMPLARDGEPQASQKSRLRAVAALTILCLGGSALVIGALDGMLLVRSSRRASTPAESDSPGEAGRDIDDDEVDGAWLESELATISRGVLDVPPATKATRGGRGAPKSRERP